MTRVLLILALLSVVTGPARAEPPPDWDTPMEQPTVRPTPPSPAAPATPPRPTPRDRPAAPGAGQMELPPFPPGDVALRAMVDPPRVLLGDKFTLVVEVRHPPGHKVVLPDGVTWTDVETAGTVQHNVRSEKRNGKDAVVEVFRFPLQAFKLGDVTTPAMQLRIPGLTVPDDALYLDALPVHIDGLKKPDDEEMQPAPMAPAVPLMREDPRFLAWPPLLILHALLFLLVRYLDKRRPVAAKMTTPLRPKPSIPAHLHALNQLEALKRAGLIENGRTAEFVDAAVQIGREYLEHAYDVPVLESTTEEAMAVLGPAVVRATMSPDRRRLARLSVDGVRKTLMFADRVKFAKMSPAVQDCARVLDEVVQIIESTRPQEAAEVRA